MIQIANIAMHVVSNLEGGFRETFSHPVVTLAWRSAPILLPLLWGMIVTRDERDNTGEKDFGIQTILVWIWKSIISLIIALIKSLFSALGIPQDWATIVLGTVIMRFTINLVMKIWEEFRFLGVRVSRAFTIRGNGNLKRSGQTLDIHPDSLWGSLFMHSEWGRSVWMIRRASHLARGFLRLEILNTSTGTSSEVLIRIGQNLENSIDFDQQICRKWIIVMNHFGVNTANSWADFVKGGHKPLEDRGTPLRRSSEVTTLSSDSAMGLGDSYNNRDPFLVDRESFSSVPNFPVKPRGAGELCRR